MSATTAARAPGLRADRLRTKRAVAGAFFAHGSPRVITAVVAATVLSRLVVGGSTWGWADLYVAAVTVVAVGPVEWVLHRLLLHAPSGAWTSRVLGTGAGHREHHLDPPALEWLLLRGVDAAVFAPVIAVFTLAWTVPSLMVLGQVLPGDALAAPVLTALVCAYLALWHYEWTHLLIHTAYRPRTRLYRRLARDHRRHHYRNERYWLGITSRTGDRLMRTAPSDSSSVPLGATARTLR
jgi:hypothetical protein